MENKIFIEFDGEKLPIATIHSHAVELFLKGCELRIKSEVVGEGISSTVEVEGQSSTVRSAAPNDKTENEFVKGLARALAEKVYNESGSISDDDWENLHTDGCPGNPETTLSEYVLAELNYQPSNRAVEMLQHISDYLEARDV